MEETVIPRPPAVTLAVHDNAARFPVRRVYCVGRNYAEHAREMGESGREPPFFFSKPADSVLNIATGTEGLLPYPSQTQDLHHEVELVVALGAGGRDLTVEQAASAVWGYAIGLDMTRRDLQAQAKKAGRPWDTAKGFDHAAPIGPVHPLSATGVLKTGSIRLTINGQLRQSGDLSDMIWSVPEAIAYLSTLFELKAGDLLYTGTPAGVGTVNKGDHLVAEIQGLGTMQLRIGS